MGSKSRADNPHSGDGASPGFVSFSLLICCLVSEKIGGKNRSLMPNFGSFSDFLSGFWSVFCGVSPTFSDIRLFFLWNAGRYSLEDCTKRQALVSLRLLWIFCFLFFVFCFWGKFSVVKSSVLKLVLYLLCLYYQQVYTFLLVLRFKLYQLVDFFSLLKYLNAHITES